MDPVDQAIAAAAEMQPITLEQRELTIASTGRPFVLAFPPDMTEAELFEVVGWMANNLRIHLAQRRQSAPAARLVLPTGPTPV